jgi:hypothetical protein
VATSSTRRVAVRALSAGADGGLVWALGGLARVQRALEAELDGAGAGQAVEDLLRLIVVLRGPRRSPEAAEALAGLLRGVPEALAWVQRRHRPVGGLEQRRQFALREGRELDHRAPVEGEGHFEGSLPLKGLIDPMARDRARAQARRLKECKDGSR